MSDIQRYSGDWSWGYVADGDPYAGLYESAGGELVKYADHVAAVAAAEQRIRTHEGCADAEQRGREEAYNEIPAIAVYGERLRSEGYDVGYTDALAAAREVVAALMPGHCSLLDPSTGYNVSIVTDAVRKDEALAAIDALKNYEEEK